LKSDPAWDEKGSGVGRREKIVSAGEQKNINMTAPVLLKFFSAQTEPFKKIPPLVGVRQTFQRLQ
jgi:hypothetical protein